MAPPRTILCTPSETLSITDLASCTYRPDRSIMVRGALTPGAPSLSSPPPKPPTKPAPSPAHLFTTLGYPTEHYRRPRPPPATEEHERPHPRLANN